MRTNTPFVIISAEKAGFNQETNDWRTRSLQGQLRSLPIQDPLPVEGKYQGVREHSWLVWLPQGDAESFFPDLTRLARRWGQESILFVDANRMAYFVRISQDKAAGPAWILAGKWEQEMDFDFGTIGDYTITPDNRLWHIRSLGA